MIDHIFIIYLNWCQYCYSLLNVFQVIYIKAYIDSKYIAKDLISIHEVWKKLLQCAKFGKCAFCGDIVRALII